MRAWLFALGAAQALALLCWAQGASAPRAVEPPADASRPAAPAEDPAAESRELLRRQQEQLQRIERSVDLLRDAVQ